MPSVIVKGGFILRASDKDKVIDVFSEILKTKYVSHEYIVHPYGTEDVMLVDDRIMKQIFLYAQLGQYADMLLHEFLDKMNTT
jgi:hypothetical protein